MKISRNIIPLLLIAIIGLTCTKEEKPIAGIGNKVEVADLIVNVSASTAVNVSASVKAQIPESIIERGFCWNTTQSPTINDMYIKISINGGFNSTINGFLPGTNYSIRAYIKTTTDVIYSKDVKFKTISIPTVFTNIISDITDKTAITGGSISSNGGSPITSKGVCWNTISTPTIANNKTQDGTGDGAFSSSLTGLNPSTVYYLRAYATNAAGTAYGPQISFTSGASPTIKIPTISTNSVTSITSSSAISGGNISSDGGSPITSKGVCWNNTGSPSISNTKTSNGTGINGFSAGLTGLNPGTVYYVRAYATNSIGTSYGQQVTFQTLSASTETCSITTVSNGTAYSMQAPTLGTILNAGSLYKITMTSSILTFGQASEVAIFKNETKAFTYGTSIAFNEAPGNAKTFTIPSGLATSACYTIRVTKQEGAVNRIYVSPKFEIR